MNANLLSRLFLAWANLCLRASELEQRVEEQATELSEIKAQLQKEIAQHQQTKALLVQVQEKLDIKADSVSGGDGKMNTPPQSQLERVLFQERNFISAILETATVLIVILDLQGRIVRFSRACEEMTGYSLEEVRGRYFWDLFLIPEEVESLKAFFNELEVGSPQNEYENYWVMRDGSRCLIRWSSTILQETDGEVSVNSPTSQISNNITNQLNNQETSNVVKYIIGCGIDLSDRYQVEAACQGLTTEEELNQLRNNFFTMASHELRTPLSVILLAVQSLEAFYYKWSDEKKLKKLSQVEAAAHRMKHLIDQILSIHRGDES